jgi:NADPH:quinone reductase
MLTLDAAAADFFSVIADGSVTLRIGTRFALADAANAHRALESRATHGSTILIP